MIRTNRNVAFTFTLLLQLTFVLVKCESESVSVQQGSTSTDDAEDDDGFEDTFCYDDPKHPFYQNRHTGTICCRGKVVPLTNLAPESAGPCKISTKSNPDGTLNSTPLWCAYTCQLKKQGIVDKDGKIVPDKFFDYISKGVSKKNDLKLIMTNHLSCFTSLQNSKHPCYAALGFHKCWKDALEYLCTNGMPENNDFSSIKAKDGAKKPTYANLEPTCTSEDGKRAMPSCCHGRPLPWLIPEIVRSSIDVKKMMACLDNFKKTNINSYTECAATCGLHALGVIDDSMELNVHSFETQVLKHFSAVKPSVWMHFLGPTFLFYDEYQTDQTNGWQETLTDTQRVCHFHHAILTLHLNKIEEHCEMSVTELKEALAKTRK